MAVKYAICKCKYCGAEFEHRVEGYNRDDAIRKAEWAESNFDTCSDCWQKQKAKKAEEAVGGELPELSGTERQVDWANKIRVDFINRCKEAMEEIEDYVAIGHGKRIVQYTNLVNNALPYFDEYVHEKTDAYWWIEHRSDSTECIFKKLEEWAITERKTPEEKQAEAERLAEEKAKAEAEALKLTVRPENTTRDNIVKLSVDEAKNAVCVGYPKDETFMSQIKGMGCKWDSIWKKYVTTLDSLLDREAEIGNYFLSKGYVVQFSCEEAMQKAITGEFADEILRYVYLIDDKFKLYWERNDKDDLYRKATSIKTARWDRGYGRISVDRSSYLEVEDFCNINGFVMSDKVKQTIAEEKAKIAGLKTVCIKKKEKSKTPETPDKLKEILNSSRDVLEDLKDES